MTFPTVSELYDLTGQVAFITGGARNLGYDMALALAEAGADVAISSRQIESARKSAALITEATGRRAFALELDVTDEDQVIAAVDACLAEYGRIDILVNNAGNVNSKPDNAPLHKRPLEEWRVTVDANMTGTFLCSKHVLDKAMIPARSGKIINLGSISGMIGRDRRVYIGTEMGGTTIDYGAAKGGIINMTRDMAVTLAEYNIRVNCISPGGFWRHQPEPFVEAYNEATPMGRMGQDGKEMKGVVVFFASEASSYCTGQNLAIDGGFTSW